MVFKGGIIVKSAREIDIMAESGEILAEAHAKMRDMIRPGMSTETIDRTYREYITAHGGKCTFKGYKGFPFNTCVSVNEEVVHGFPSERKLKEGDIVSIDAGVTYKDFVSDSAVTFPVGKVSPEVAKLLKVTRECLRLGIEACVPGNHIRDIGVAVEGHAHENGFSVVRKFVGHGVGRSMHEKPEVPNFVTGRKGVKLSPGLTIAIEPMVNAGGDDVHVLANGWTVVTSDGRLSAHFEHTVAVTESGPRVLTTRPGEEDEDF